MSWYINTVGKPYDVKIQIAADLSLPQSLKDVVAAFADAMSDQPDKALQVKSAGHFSSSPGSFNSIGEFSIATVTLAPTAPPAPVVTPPSAPDTAAAPSVTTVPVTEESVTQMATLAPGPNVSPN